MAPSSPSVPGKIAVETQAAWRLLDALVQFLVRRRILLSAILFAVLVVKHLANGTKPHDLADLGDPYSVLGVALVAIGLALRSWAAGILRKNAALTTSGPYRLIRNPLYVGSFLMMLGFCALLNDLGDLWFILGPVLLLYIIKVRQEERLLADLFPSQWPEYARATPRFFPRLARFEAADWRAAQWLRSREYRALGATIWALVAIKLWQTFG
jgi:protein-S-isoprenylcysteine O-methyltransferase Ste14